MADWYLIDAVERHAESPETFELPTREELDNLKEGDFVKLMFAEHQKEGEQVERMWVKLSKLNKQAGSIEGVVDNDPLLLKTVAAGDIVSFRTRDIIQVLNDA